MKKVDDDHAVDVDSLHRGGFTVEGRRAHRLAESRLATSSVSAIISATAVRITSDAGRSEMLSGPQWMPLDEIDVLVGLVATEVGAEEEQRGRLEEKGDPSARDERGDSGGDPERPVGKALDPDPKEPGPEHRDPQHDRD